MCAEEDLREYLRRHKVEDVMNDLVGLIAATQPAEPWDFVADRLAALADAGARAVASGTIGDVRTAPSLELCTAQEAEAISELLRAQLRERLRKSDQEEWLRRRKWLGFYEGWHAPHLSSARGTLELLPWRSGKPTTALVEHLASGALDGSVSAIELGCGTGENLVCLAGAARAVTGVDIAPVAVVAAQEAITRSRVQNARVLEADLLAPPDELQGAFDFAFDCQTYQCLRQVSIVAAGAAVAGVLRLGGTLLLLTGNADEPEERGPVRLTRRELEDGLVPAGLELVSCDPFFFDETEAYRVQAEERGLARPPRGWRSLWVRVR